MWKITAATRYMVFTALRIKIAVFWDVTWCDIYSPEPAASIITVDE
jgi:hypothetical protein